MSGFSVILVPTDLSEPARGAFGLACTLAGRGGRLIVAHVAGDEPGAFPNDLADVPAEWLGVSRPGDPTLRIERVVCDGPPAEAIIALAEKLGCELIVLGAQGYDRLLTGPVAQEVLRRASCPVLCLPTSSPAPTSTSTSTSTLADGVFATPSPTDLSAFFAAE